MVSVHIHWDHSTADLPALHMLSSLSSTCPSTDTTENASSRGHKTPSISDSLSLSDIQPRATKRMLTPKVKEEAIRLAKQQIRSKLREDWTWPPTSSSPDALTPTDTFSEWRERDSDSSLASQPQDSNPDPYKYDSPDSLHQPVLSRKRKRKRRLRDEMEWNEGLRTYTERRDAWTGARTTLTLTPAPLPTFTSPFDSPYSQDRLPPTGTISAPSSPPTFVPVAPPILPPDHPIRATVQPATYPHIYSAVVVQSLAPTIPVNLKDIVNALVSGWKKDGEWPPKSDAEKADGMGLGMVMGTGSLPRKAVRRSVGKVKRALGFRHGEEEGGEEEEEEDEEEGKPF